MANDERLTTPRQEQNFWAKVNKGKPDQCHEWTASKDSAGHGVFRMNGVRRRAHRIAFETYEHPIPDDLPVQHLCMNPSCVNVLHLYVDLGELTEPTARRVTRDEQEEIKSVYSDGLTTQKALAEIYEISISDLRDILAGNYQ